MGAEWVQNVCAVLTLVLNASTILAMNEGKDPRKVNSLDFGWQVSEALVLPFIQRTCYYHNGGFLF